MGKRAGLLIVAMWRYACTLLHTCCHTYARTCVYMGMGIDRECTIIVFIHLFDYVVLGVSFTMRFKLLFSRSSSWWSQLARVYLQITAFQTHSELTHLNTLSLLQHPPQPPHSHCPVTVSSKNQLRSYVPL